ncbi:hypothetical protein BCU68_16690 [Vibrio sp. 10N.286.49.B3]|nr:hypothetical protein BCU68_16690 [Vibrio sp. 10N.286.49.B3]
MLLSSHGRTQQTLITTMPMIELSSYFSTNNLLPELRWAIDAAANSKNADKVQRIQNEQQKIVIEQSVSAPLSLTFAIVGKPILTGVSHPLSTLNYNSSDTFVVGNVLGLIAICKFLGLKTFLFSSRFTAKEAHQRGELRQRIAMESVEVRIVFDHQQGLSTGHVIELFKKSSIFDSSLSLPHLDDGKNLLSDDHFPLKPFIEQLISDANIESYGGVNFDSKHIKVSERYITTQYVLFKLIIGAVAGVGTQEYSKMPKDIMLPDGTSITSVLCNGYITKIIIFLSVWLKALKEVFLNDRTSYHLSPQIWQALGLTIHQLVNDGKSESELEKAAGVLGALDYGKNAEHWNSCTVMEMDAKGRIYKNAASSTRLFRVGLSKYFIEVINNIDHQ